MSGCISLNFPALRWNWFSQLHFHFTHQPTTGLGYLQIRQYVRNMFRMTSKNLINSCWSIIYLFSEYENLSIPFRYFANKQTDRQAAGQIITEVTNMSVLLIVGPKCTLAASHAVPGWVTLSMPTGQTDWRTDGRQRKNDDIDVMRLQSVNSICAATNVL